VGRDDKSTEVKRRGAASRADGPLCLEVVAGSAAGRVLALEPGQTVLGRGSSADLVLDDTGISRHHARVGLNEEGMLTVEDLQSTNGVYVNGRLTDVAVLREGDRIELGPDAIIRVARGTSGQGRHGASGRLAALSPRELEVAGLAARGLTNAAIGKRLSISSGTVARHLANAYEKLEVGSRTALARLVIDAGLG